MKTFLFIISLLPFAVFANQTELVVLNGLPIVKCTSTFENSVNTQLTEDEAKGYRVLILKKGSEYIWATRGNKKLTKVVSGDVTIFTEVGGAGYIRVVETDGQILYLEHMGLVMRTISYWGTSSSFNP